MRIVPRSSYIVRAVFEMSTSRKLLLWCGNGKTIWSPILDPCDEVYSY